MNRLPMMSALFLGGSAMFLSTLACRPSSNGAAVKAVLATGDQDSLVYHVVTFRFKSDPASIAKIPSVVEAFAALKNKSLAADGSGRKLITSFVYGSNNSTEQLSFGQKKISADRSTEFTFIATFANIADRDYYVDREPSHQEFKTLVGELLEDGANSIFVTDFTSVKGPTNQLRAPLAE